jgi:hypothetical protein
MPTKKQNTSKHQQKACVGCQEKFLTYRNYDYCQDCAINDNRYVQNQCPECGDGSGKIKFKNQPIRPCKLCHLNKNMTKRNLSLKNQKPTNPETQF